MKMRCASRDNPTEWGLVFMGARQDHVGRDVIIARLRENDVFVDVGANCGAYSLFAARNVGPNGRVIAIEPMPEMLKRLRYNIAVNGFRNIEVVPTAVGPEAGTATLFVDEARRGLSSMEKLEGTTPLQVPVATLLSVVNRSGIDRIDALKIDIEGFEDRALLPFIGAAPRALWPKRIYMETDWAARWERDCIAGLIAAGYGEAWRSRGDILLRLLRGSLSVTLRLRHADQSRSGPPWPRLPPMAQRGPRGPRPSWPKWLSTRPATAFCSSENEA